MRTLWPWIVMGAGVIGLFVYRFLITKRRLLSQQTTVTRGNTGMGLTNEPGMRPTLRGKEP